MIVFQCPVCHNWHKKTEFNDWMSAHRGDYEHDLPETYEEMIRRFDQIGCFDEKEVPDSVETINIDAA